MIRRFTLWTSCCQTLLAKAVQGFAFWLWASCCPNASEGSRSARFAAQACPRFRVLRISLAKIVRGFTFWTSSCTNLSEGSCCGRPAGNSVSGWICLWPKASRSGFNYFWIVSPLTFEALCLQKLAKGSRSGRLLAKICPRVRCLCVLLAKAVRGLAVCASCWPKLSKGSRSGSGRLAAQTCPKVRVLRALLPKLVRGFAFCASRWRKMSEGSRSGRLAAQICLRDRVGFT